MKLISAALLAVLGVTILAVPSLACHVSGHDCGIAMSVSNVKSPLIAQMLAGARSAASRTNANLLSVLDAQGNAARQNSQLEELLGKRPDLVIIHPADSDLLVPAVKRLNMAGVRVITVDRPLNGGEIIAHIASDNFSGGRMAAEFIGKRLNGHGNVAMLEGNEGSWVSRDRAVGFREGLKKYPGISLLVSERANFDQATALHITKNVLRAQQRIDAIFAHSDNMALGAIQAIQEISPQKRVIVVGFDGTPNAITAIKAGWMTATLAHQPREMGRLAIETAVRILLKQDVPKLILVPTNIVTKESTK